MNIETLAEGLYDDSNGLVTSIRLSADGELLFDLECDDWNDPQRRRQFTIKCKQLLDTDLCVGSANAISIHREHPLLLDRVGKQGGLYFSSRPQDAHQIYADTWDILNERYQGWAVPSEVIGHSPSSFHALLNGGYGLLLRGPLSVLASVQIRIGTSLNTQLVETHIGQANAVVLAVEDHFVVCGEVEVAEHGA
jgi:hypothetical protein